MKKLLANCVLFVTGIAPIAVNAEYVYTYTGKPYDVLGNPPIGIQLYVTVNSPFRFAATSAVILPDLDSVTMTDGVYTCTATNSATSCSPSAISTGIYDIQLQTDSSGKISTWEFGLFGDYSTMNVLVATSSMQGFFGFGGQDLFDMTAYGDNGDGGSNVVGTWSVTQVPSMPVVLPIVGGTLGANGWYVSRLVTLSWKVGGYPRPAESGCGTVDVPESTGTTYICSATNSLGNGAQQITIKKDAVAPKVTIGRPASGATYVLNSRVTASYKCTDATSGVATCQGPVADKARLPTTVAGTFVFQVNSTDNAGNISSAVVSYTIQ